MIHDYPDVDTAYLPALKVGGLYPARVVGRLAGGRVNLELGGRAIPAQDEVVQLDDGKHGVDGSRQFIG